MKKGGGKGKGNRFENFVGRLLSLWLTHGRDGTQLISSRGSGGWKHAKERHAADLAANGPSGELFRQHFIVECKHHNKDLLWSLFYPSDKSIPGWWRKIVREAKALQLIPMLVCRQNSRPLLVGLPLKLARAVAGKKILLEYRRPGEACGLMLWDTFVAHTSQEIYRLAKKEKGGR